MQEISAKDVNSINVNIGLMKIQVKNGSDQNLVITGILFFQ